MPLVEIESFADPTIADIARGRLAAEGIDAVLLGAGLASLGLGVIAPVRLMVEPRDRLRAAAILSGDTA
jgi:hypothetical protein